MGNIDRALWDAPDRRSAAVRIAGIMVAAYEMGVDVTGCIASAQDAEDTGSGLTSTGQLDYGQNAHIPLRGFMDAAGVVANFWEDGVISVDNVGIAVDYLYRDFSVGKTEWSGIDWADAQCPYCRKLKALTWAFETLIEHRRLLQELADRIEAGGTITPQKLRKLGDRCADQEPNRPGVVAKLTV